MRKQTGHATGVTYIGPRAFVITFCVVCGAFLALFFAVGRVADRLESVPSESVVGLATRGPVAVTPTVAIAQPSPNFGRPESGAPPVRARPSVVPRPTSAPRRQSASGGAPARISVITPAQLAAPQRAPQVARQRAPQVAGQRALQPAPQRTPQLAVHKGRRPTAAAFRSAKRKPVSPARPAFRRAVLATTPASPTPPVNGSPAAGKASQLRPVQHPASPQRPDAPILVARKAPAFRSSSLLVPFAQSPTQSRSLLVAPSVGATPPAVRP